MVSEWFNFSCSLPECFPKLLHHFTFPTTVPYTPPSGKLNAHSAKLAKLWDWDPAAADNHSFTSTHFTWIPTTRHYVVDSGPTRSPRQLCEMERDGGLVTLLPHASSGPLRPFSCKREWVPEWQGWVCSNWQGLPCIPPNHWDPSNS